MEYIKGPVSGQGLSFPDIPGISYWVPSGNEEVDEDDRILSVPMTDHSGCAAKVRIKRRLKQRSSRSRDGKRSGLSCPTATCSSPISRVKSHQAARCARSSAAAMS